MACLIVPIFFWSASTFFCISTRALPIWLIEVFYPKSPCAEATCNDTPPKPNPSRNAAIKKMYVDRVAVIDPFLVV